jgi:exosome complex component RRP40
MMAVDESLTDDIIVLPGERVRLPTAEGSQQKTTIGVGLFEEKTAPSAVNENVVVAHNAGTLRKSGGGEGGGGGSTYWVDTNRTRYYPKKGDQIVGLIEERGGDYYVINIFSGFNCILSRLAFEGATKRSKPELKKGDLVYARVLAASDDEETVDTELSCLTTSGPKKEWTTGETVRFGNNRCVCNLFAMC